MKTPFASLARPSWMRAPSESTWPVEAPSSAGRVDKKVGFVMDGKSYLGDDGLGYLWEDEHPGIRLGTVYRSSDGVDYLCYVRKLNVTKRATERFGEANHEGAWVRSCGVWQPSHYSTNLGRPLNNYLQHVAYAPRQPVKAWLWRRWIDLRWWIARIQESSK